MHKNIISIDHKIGTKIRKGIRNLVNHPFLSTRVINFRHSVLFRRRGKVLPDTTMCKWNGRIEKKRNSIESILALEGFLAWLRIIHQACSISRHPRFMELDGIFGSVYGSQAGYTVCRLRYTGKTLSALTIRPLFPRNN